MDYNYQWSSQRFEPMLTCEWCRENHVSVSSQYYANTYTYNPAWGDHQNLPWNYNNHTFKPQYFQHQEKKFKLEEVLEQLNQNLKNFMENTDTINKNRETSMKNHNPQVKYALSLSRKPENDPKEQEEATIL